LMIYSLPMLYKC